jgi:hypothetical protein
MSSGLPKSNSVILTKDSIRSPEWVSTVAKLRNIVDPAAGKGVGTLDLPVSLKSHVKEFINDRAGMYLFQTFD